MVQPVWLGDGFAGVLVLVGGYCLARLVLAAPLGRRTHYDVNLDHVLMAVAMAGMLVNQWRVLPDPAWAVVFGLLGGWFLARAGLVAGRTGVKGLSGPSGLHARHYAVHGVMALAMVYAEVLAASMPARGVAVAGMMSAGRGSPALTLAFVLVLLVSAVWQLNGVERPSSVHASPVGPGAFAVTAAGRSMDAGISARPARPWLAPRLEVGCHIAMCLAMAYMLVLVL